MCQTGIVVTLAFSVTVIAILSDLWGKEWKTLLLSLQVRSIIVLLQLHWSYKRLLMC